MHRAMEFVVALLKRLHDDQSVTLATAANEVYYATLYKYHGWITSSAFVLALKVCLLNTMTWFLSCPMLDIMRCCNIASSAAWRCLPCLWQDRGQSVWRLQLCSSLPQGHCQSYCMNSLATAPCNFCHLQICSAMSVALGVHTVP